MKVYVFTELCHECGRGGCPVGVTDDIEHAKQKVSEHRDLAYEEMDLNTLEAKYAMSAERRSIVERELR